MKLNNLLKRALYLAVAFQLALHQPAIAQDIYIKGLFTCKIVYKNITGIHEGKPKIYSELKGGYNLGLGDFFSIEYTYGTPVGYQEKMFIYFSSNLGFHRNRPFSSLNMVALDYFVQREPLPRSLSNPDDDSISWQKRNEKGEIYNTEKDIINFSDDYLNINDTAFSLDLDRYYKNDWSGYITQRLYGSKWIYHHVGVDCRHSKDLLDEIRKDLNSREGF